MNLQSLNKPFIVVLNTSKPNSQETKVLKKELEDKYNVTVQVMDVYNMEEQDIEDLFKYVLKEFPIKEINIDMPEWLEKLECNHWLKKDFFNIIMNMSQDISRVRDIKYCLNNFEEEDFMGTATIKEVDLGNGMAKVLMKPKGWNFL